MSRPAIDPVTYMAVAELVQAAAHRHGLTGPVQFTVCRPVALSDSEILNIRSQIPTPFDPDYLKNTEAFDS